MLFSKTILNIIPSTLVGSLQLKGHSDPICVVSPELACYRTITAENGKPAVEMALKELPAVIVCDIMMPELDGYEVLHLLRRNVPTQNIHFIFLTAKTKRSDFGRGLEMCADDYITKPFDDLELLNAVETRLRKIEILDKKYTASQQGLSDFLRDVKGAGLLEKLADQYDVQQYDKKQILYAEGRKPKSLFYLLKGKVKGVKLSEGGKEYITNLYNDGSFIGYAALLDDKNYDDSAIILEDASIIPIPKDDFLQVIYSDISIASRFIQIITQNVKEQEDRLVNLAFSSLRKRVAAAMVDMVVKFGPNDHTNAIEISREDFTRYVGTATESLIRTLSDFKAEKLIEIQHGKIVVRDLNTLRNLLY